MVKPKGTTREKSHSLVQGRIAHNSRSSSSQKKKSIFNDSQSGCNGPKCLQFPKMPIQPLLVAPSSVHRCLNTSHPLLNSTKEEVNLPLNTFRPGNISDEPEHFSEPNYNFKRTQSHQAQGIMPATQQIHFMVKQKIYPTRSKRNNHVQCDSQNELRINKWWQKKKKQKNRAKLLERSKAEQGEGGAEKQSTDVADVNSVMDGTKKTNASSTKALDNERTMNTRVEDFRSAANRAIRDAKKDANDATNCRDGLAKVLRHLGMKHCDVEYIIAAYKDKKSVRRACRTVLGAQKVEAVQDILRGQISG